MPPPLPVTVIGYVPTGVVDPTLIVMVDVPEPGAGIAVGLKVTVVPAGARRAERAIALLKPPLTVVVMVEVPGPPCATLTVVGKAEMVKFTADCVVPMTRLEYGLGLTEESTA